MTAPCSQDEIDALLGGDSPPAMPANGNSDGLGHSEESVIVELLGSIAGSLNDTITGIMAKSTELDGPVLSIVDKEEFLSALPDEVIEIRSAFKEGLTGSHLHIVTPDDALKIASPMIGQDELELNETTIGAVSEAMSQITGVALTAIGNKINTTVLPEPPEGKNVPKAALSLPGDRFVQVLYKAQIEGEESISIQEIFELPLMKDLANRLGAAPESQGHGGDSMADLLGGVDGRQADASPGLFDSPLGGALGMGQGGPNVQGVQLPNLSPMNSSGEQRNMGILMDVSMELTVELGRTKWKIKDILGMGEGTIIELDKLAGEPVDILVNNNLLARGEVVVIDENFGVRVTEIVTTIDRVTER